MPYKVKKITRVDTSSLDSLGQSVTDLSKYTEDEFGSLARSLQAIEPRQVLYVAPPKPRQGMQVYADGTRWNPGAGEGFYEYTSGGVWVPMFINSASGVTSIAGNRGAFTLNATSGISNAVNDIQLLQASATQFGACKVDGTTITAAGGVLSVPAGAQPAMVLLETLPLTGLAAVNSSVSWAAYKHIKLIASNISASSSASNIPCIMYHSGGAYQTTGYVSNGALMNMSGTTWTQVWGGTLSTVIGLYGGIQIDVPTLPDGVSVEATIFDINGGGKKYTEAHGVVVSTTIYYSITGGVWNGANTVIDGIRFALGGGANFAQGTLSIYGIK